MKSEEVLPLTAPPSSAPNNNPAAMLAPRFTVDELVSGLTRFEQSIRNEAELDRFLRRLVEATRLLLGATGAAIALRDRQLYRWRAKSGEIGPPLGAPVPPAVGISGQCLATGTAQYCRDTSNDTRVEPVHCQRLGLASIAVAPIVKAGNIEGILEAWSGQAQAFDRRRLELLENMAALAAIVKRPSAEKRDRVAPQLLRFVIQQSSCNGMVVALKSRWMPAGRQALRGTKDLAGGMLNLMKRTCTHRTPRFGKFGWIFLRSVFVVVLFGLLVWSAWHGRGIDAASASVSPEGNENRPVLALALNNSLAPPAVPLTLVPFTHSAAAMQLVPQHSPDLAIPLIRERFPEDTYPVARMTPPILKPLLLRTQRSTTSEDVVPPAIAAVEAASSSNKVTDQVRGLFEIRPDTPTLVPSHGLTGGSLRVRTEPAYPELAKSAGIEGTVRLQAVIDEQGTVEEVTVSDGQPILARAAIEAVEHWRYDPYVLDDRPVRMPAEIRVVFKLK